jgi:hypothetical protein
MNLFLFLPLRLKPGGFLIYDTLVYVDLENKYIKKD